VCNTRHASRGECPGELLVSEPERHGWRVLVHTGGRTEVYGVLVAPTGDRWRSRILTYPNMLWSVPGGRGTMKFVGATAQEAERAAIDFIHEHCNQRGHSLLGEPALVESGGLDREAEPSSPGKLQAVGRRRYLKLLPVLYGTEKPTFDGRTADLSLGGLFIVTEKPLPVNVLLKLKLDLDGFVVPMKGRVAWSRSRQEQGRPAGMGIELIHAPPMYHRYVRSLKDQRGTTESD